MKPKDKIIFHFACMHGKLAAAHIDGVFGTGSRRGLPELLNYKDPLGRSFSYC